MNWSRMLLQRELIFKSLMATIILCTMDCIAEEEMPAELVTRRHFSDIYQNYNSDVAFLCSEGNNLTFLVDERQCVDQQQLLNGCSFSVTPNEEFSSFTVTLVIADRVGTNLLGSATTVNSLNEVVDAVIAYRGTNLSQPVNGSQCIISNLEVYRGRDQVIEIESGGFSLNERGFIEINNNSLVYNVEEYLGELYRMNLSCSGGGLPESGCLFFKVIGQTNVTSVKFNDLVPGTVYGREGDAPTTTMSTSTTSTKSTIDTTVSTNQQPTLLPTTFQMSGSNTTSAPSGVDNRTLMYAIYAIAAIGVVALLVVVILLCAVIAFLLCPSSRNKRKRESVNLTASKNLPSETSDLTATAPMNIPITQQDLPPPPDPKWDANPAYNVAELSTSWNEGSNV